MSRYSHKTLKRPTLRATQDDTRGGESLQYNRKHELVGIILVDQVKLETLVRGHFQTSTKMLNRIQVWAMAGPLEDTHGVVLKPLPRQRVVFPMKDERSSPSESQELMKERSWPKCSRYAVHL